MSAERQPLTSVVIPAYNAEPFIARTLRSVLQQTYRNLEIIVVDDGSTDRTSAVATTTAAADPRFKIFSVPNGGVARARNYGLERASGEFVAFLDADDLWHPSKVTAQVAALSSKSGEEAAAVYTLSRIIDMNDRVIRSENRCVFNGYSFARHLYCKPVGNGSSVLIRRKVAITSGGFDPTYADSGIGGCEDLDFELKIAAAHPLAALPLYLVGYRAYPGNMSSNRLRMARAALETIRNHIRSCPDLPKFAARHAYAETLAYAVENLVTGRHWKLAGLEFGTLLRMEVGRGFQLGTRIVMSRVDRLKRAFPLTASETRERPLFYELGPDSGADISERPRDVRRQQVIDQLAAIDLVLEKRLQAENSAKSLPELIEKID